VKSKKSIADFPMSVTVALRRVNAGLRALSAPLEPEGEVFQKRALPLTSFTRYALAADGQSPPVVRFGSDDLDYAPLEDGEYELPGRMGIEFLHALLFDRFHHWARGADAAIDDLFVVLEYVPDNDEDGTGPALVCRLLHKPADKSGSDLAQDR
jgi:hypothetical protein